MNRSRIAVLLAAAGVALVGPLTTDAVAFARAFESGEDLAFKKFAVEYPTSPFVAKARQYASCTTNFKNGRCRESTGNSGNRGGGQYGG